MKEQEDHDQRCKVLLQACLAEFIALITPDWQGQFRYAGAEWLQQEAYLPLEGTQQQEFERLSRTQEFDMVRVLGKTTYEKGIEKGIEKGEMQGSRKALRALMKAKFQDAGAAL